MFKSKVKTRHRKGRAWRLWTDNGQRNVKIELVFCSQNWQNAKCTYICTPRSLCPGVPESLPRQDRESLQDWLRKKMRDQGVFCIKTFFLTKSDSFSPDFLYFVTRWRRTATLCPIKSETFTISVFLKLALVRLLNK